MDLCCIPRAAFSSKRPQHCYSWYIRTPDCLHVFGRDFPYGCRCAELEARLGDAHAKVDSASEQARCAATAASQAAAAASDAASELERQMRVREVLEQELHQQHELARELEQQVMELQEQVCACVWLL